MKANIRTQRKKTESFLLDLFYWLFVLILGYSGPLQMLLTAPTAGERLR
jgi:hypothetical protein